MAPYGEKAKKYKGGFIDLSQGTPVDPTPKFIQDSLTAASNSPSYPVVAGSKELQDAIRSWSIKHLGVTASLMFCPQLAQRNLLPYFQLSYKVKKSCIQRWHTQPI